MFGINEVKAMISASDARALRQHQETMEELHDLNMQLEGLHDVLERVISDLKPVQAKSETKPSNVKVKK